MEGAPDEHGAEPVTVRCLMEVSDVLASRRLFWPRAYWFDRASIAIFVGAGVTAELLLPSAIVFWAGFYVLAALSAIRLFILVPRAVATSQRSVIGKINVVRLDEDGVHDDLGGIRLDLRGGYSMPKRAFATPAECEAFVRYARARITPPPDAPPLSHRSSPPGRR